MSSIVGMLSPYSCSTHEKKSVIADSYRLRVNSPTNAPLSVPIVARAAFRSAGLPRLAITLFRAIVMEHPQGSIRF